LFAIFLIIAHLHIFALVPTCQIFLHVHFLLGFFLPICCLFVFFNTYSCCSCLLIAFSRCFCLLVALLCYLALAQQCLMNPLKLKLHACQCLKYSLKCKLPPHQCLKYPLKFKLLVHHLLVVVCLLFPFVWYFPFLPHVGCGMRRRSMINGTSCFFFVFLFVCTFNGLEEAESQGRNFLWCPKRNWNPYLCASKTSKIWKNGSKLRKSWVAENRKVKKLKR
jgi:hypothetical protein